MPVSLNRLRSLLTPFLLFLGSFILRLSLISKGPYHADCLVLAVRSKEFLSTFQIVNLHGSGHPLAVVLGAFFVRMCQVVSVHDPVAAVNFMSVVLSSLSVMAFYFVAKIFINERTALFSSILFSVHPIFLGTSVYGNTHTPSIFFFMCALWALMNDRVVPRNFWIVLCGISLGFMGASRIEDLFVVLLPVLALACVFSREKKIPLKGFLGGLLLGGSVMGLVLAISYAPIYIAQARSSHEGNFLYNIKVLIISLKNVRWFRVEIAFDYVVKSFTIPGFIFSLVGLVFLFVRERKYIFVFLSWLLCTFFFFAYLVFEVPRFFILTSVPLLISQGYLLSLIEGRNVRLRRNLTIGGLLVLVFMMLGTIYPALQFRHRAQWLPDFYLWVASVTERNAVIIDRDHSLFVKYYAQREFLGTRIDLFKADPQEFKDFFAALDEKLDKGLPVYITGRGLLAYNKKIRFDQHFRERYQLKFVGDHRIELWQRGCLDQRLGRLPLYSVTRKQ